MLADFWESFCVLSLEYYSARKEGESVDKQALLAQESRRSSMGDGGLTLPSFMPLLWGKRSYELVRDQICRSPWCWSLGFSYAAIFRSPYLLSFVASLTRLATPCPNEILNHFDHFLGQVNDVNQLRQVHGQIIATGCCKSGFLSSRIISKYGSFGLVSEARKVFETALAMCFDSILLWNSVLRVNVSHGNSEDVLKLYVRMKRLGVMADGFTFPLVIRACTVMGNYDFCWIIHAHVLQIGLHNNVYPVNELLGCYGKVGKMDAAEKLFNEMPVRTYISWNTMISGFSFNHDCSKALRLFKSMEMEGLEPNVVTWTALLSSHARCGLDEETLKLFVCMRNSGIGSNAEALAVVLSACAGLDNFVEGKVIHGYAIIGGFEDYMIVKNSLISLYGKHGHAEDSRNLFMEMKLRSIVTWNSLISAYSDSGFCDEAFEIFSQLEKSGLDKKLQPNVISWSAVISGFAQKDRGEEALQLFRRMQAANITSNPVTISSVLSICADLAALPLGQEIHAHTIKNHVDDSVLVNNGLINMYAKCGNFREGQLIFERMNTRDLISWNSLIAGYGIHGYGINALETFNRLIKEGLIPDGITFIAVLSACGHAGLVSEGREIFNRMNAEFGIEPQIEHYACIVDLLGRAGLVKEASEIVKSMPMEPNSYVLGALLNASRVHKNTDMAEEIAAQILSLNSNTAGNYMLLSNIYSAAGRWSDSAKVRMSARMNGFKKITGQSWIEVNKRVYVFSAGSFESDLKEVYKILEELRHRFEDEGYVVDKSFVLQNVDDDEKKQMLNGHSEKLAIAFGHAEIPLSMPIRVMKNLRVCGDCHTWTKYFSKVTGRVVIVRDARRFHRFVNGSCSCNDYW
ncbi:hypothetical protein V2J09_020849 [Rumex salicifolius]